MILPQIEQLRHLKGVVKKRGWRLRANVSSVDDSNVSFIAVTFDRNVTLLTTTPDSGSFQADPGGGYVDCIAAEQTAANIITFEFFDPVGGENIPWRILNGSFCTPNANPQSGTM